MQKGSLFNVTLGNYATKTVKKTVKNCENGQKTQKKGSLFNATLGNFATKTAKKTVKNCENGPK